MTGTSSDSLDLAAIQYTKKDFKILGLQNFDIPDNLKGEICLLYTSDAADE